MSSVLHRTVSGLRYVRRVVADRRAPLSAGPAFTARPARVRPVPSVRPPGGRALARLPPDERPARPEQVPVRALGGTVGWITVRPITGLRWPRTLVGLCHDLGGYTKHRKCVRRAGTCPRQHPSPGAARGRAAPSRPTARPRPRRTLVWSSAQRPTEPTSAPHSTTAAPEWEPMTPGRQRGPHHPMPTSSLADGWTTARRAGTAPPGATRPVQARATDVGTDPELAQQAVGERRMAGPCHRRPDAPPRRRPLRPPRGLPLRSQCGPSPCAHP